MLWYRFIGAAHWIYHGSQLVAGISLGILGLLDIGNKHVDITTIESQGLQTLNPLYRILFHEVPLVIIAMVYLVVYLGSGAALWLLQRRQEKRRKVDDTEKRKLDPSPGEQRRSDDAPRAEDRGLGVQADDQRDAMQERR